MSAHYSLSPEEDYDGFNIPRCICGWEGGPCPDVETATDALMDHAYDVGRRFFAQPLGDGSTAPAFRSGKRTGGRSRAV